MRENLTRTRPYCQLPFIRAILLLQIKKGQFYGPFGTAEEMIESLHRNGKKSKKPVKRSARR